MPSMFGILQVRHDDVRRVRLEALEGGRAVLRDVHRVALLLQELLEARARAGFVVHDEDMGLRLFGAHVRSLRIERKLYPKHRMPRAALDGDVAAVVRDDAMRDGEAEARAIRLGREERVEDRCVGGSEARDRRPGLRMLRCGVASGPGG